MGNIIISFGALSFVSIFFPDHVTAQDSQVRTSPARERRENKIKTNALVVQ